MRQHWMMSASGLALALFMLACSSPRDESEDRSSIIHPITIKIDVVRADPWPDVWEASGFLRRSQPVTLASRMSGVVKRVAVSRGQRVKAGDLLVVFDTGDIDASMKEADMAKPTSPETVRRAGEAVEMARLNLDTAKTEDSKKAARAVLARALNEQAALRTRSSGLDGAQGR